jgi:signal transduction histidine kinase/DNA-binding NarL/FixJ family response regulator
MDASPTSTAPHRDPAVLSRLAAVSRAAGLAASLVALGALASWAGGPVWLRSGGRLIETQPNSAAGLLLAGLAIVIGPASAGRARRAISVLLAGAAVAIGALTLFQQVTGVDLGIDLLLFARGATWNGLTSPGRMGPPAALSLLLAGLAILAMHVDLRGGHLAGQILALGTAPLPMLALVGYAYDVTLLQGIAIALPTAVALLLLDLAIVLARPDHGFVGSLASDGSGSAIARRMLVYAIALPFVLGWLALAASAGGRDAAFTVSIMVAALTLILVVLVLRDAGVVVRLEAAKERAQQEEAISREALARALRREQEARAQAEAASRAKDEFLNALSHELRTPLNAILGWSRLLRDDGADSDRLARGLAVVDRNGRALAQVVSDLLDMSRIARGVIHMERLDADLVAAVESAADAVRAAATAKGIVLARSLGEGVPQVFGDPARLQQIAWNLIANAVKFTPPGGRVEVVLGVEDGRPVLTVQDTGAGISPEFLPHVFERFRQADGSSTRRHAGLGLGLALTRELVILHGGTIEVASAGVGRGATFRVTFPPAAATVPDAAPVPRRERLGGARILVVDDEADSRDLLLQLLASWGARPAGAGSAREALALAARERPDLLVSDIAMPGEDGCSLVQELRRSERSLGQLPIPAVALTAFARPEDRRRVLAAGFDAHVAKPVEPDDLLDTLKRLLERRPRAALEPQESRTPAPPEARSGPHEPPRQGGEALAAG